jgi:NADH:ubiquinone oxidoreductase subunit 6 (subunit J)
MTSLFFVFASVMVMSGIMVIQARNPVYSVLFLILVFLNASGMLVHVGLDFFALLFLVVYVGAIAVLFLFVVMMLPMKLAELTERRLRYLPVGGVLGAVFLFEVFLILDREAIPLLGALPSSLQFREWPLLVDAPTCLSGLGQLLYTHYVLQFLMASLILLVAMVGAIVLTMHRSLGMKRQGVMVQTMRDFARTVEKGR